MSTDQARRLDDNLVLEADAVACAHCGTIANAGDEPFLSRAVLIEGNPDQAGPQVHAGGRQFVDPEVVFRQRVCAGCGVALLTEVVPAQDPPMRTKKL